MANIEAAEHRIITDRSSITSLVVVFIISIFFSAALLFSVQPMFTKMVLPLLGGTPNVWNTAMVFFQASLLGGYLYAHVISQTLALRWQVLAHALVTSVGLLFLPLSIASGWTPPEGGVQSLWLMALFGVSVGVPFFAISANAPLLQRWFSYTQHKDADDPYFLYAASNTGSLLSLCLYPVLFEPFLRLNEQTDLWSKGYVGLIILLLCAGVFAARHLRAESEPASKLRIDSAAKQTSHSGSISSGMIAQWVFLAFIPSSLMLGVTTHITYNLASTPFLWIIPLALYLVTFIFAFKSKPLISVSLLKKMTPFVIILAFVSGYMLKHQIFLSISLTLVCFFLLALTCHSRLYETRPAAEKLTQFYIWMSVGGVLGGAFNALLAPQIFTGTYEYILVMCVSILAASSLSLRAYVEQMKALRGFLLMSAAVFILTHFIDTSTPIRVILVALPIVFGWKSSGNFVVFTLSRLVILVFVALMSMTLVQPGIYKDRSFFGVLRVDTLSSDFGPVHKFVHGDTIHNYQFRDEALRTVPLAYYGEGGAFERAISAARSRKANLNVSMIGLGAGAMACYERPGDSWTYFEIDPGVVKMAKNPALFSYLSECSIASDVRIGDARLTLTALPPASQDIIFVDAFSSDSIPTHLLTREAMAIYRSRLADNGLIFFHTTNRAMDVSSVVGRLAADAGLEARLVERDDFEGMPYAEFYARSYGVLVGANDDIEAVVGQDPNWRAFEPSSKVRLWTDDYSSILGSMLAHQADEKNTPGGLVRY